MFIIFFTPSNLYLLHNLSLEKLLDKQYLLHQKLKIIHYDGQGNMVLRTLTGSGYVTLQKRTSDSSVRSMSAIDGNATYYTLKGEKTEEPSIGINIIGSDNSIISPSIFPISLHSILCSSTV